MTASAIITLWESLTKYHTNSSDAVPWLPTDIIISQWWVLEKPEQKSRQTIMQNPHNQFLSHLWKQWQDEWKNEKLCVRYGNDDEKGKRETHSCRKREPIKTQVKRVSRWWQSVMIPVCQLLENWLCFPLIIFLGLGTTISYFLSSWTLMLLLVHNKACIIFGSVVVECPKHCPSHWGFRV